MLRQFVESASWPKAMSDQVFKDHGLSGRMYAISPPLPHFQRECGIAILGIVVPLGVTRVRYSAPFRNTTLHLSEAQRCIMQIQYTTPYRSIATHRTDAHCCSVQKNYAAQNSSAMLQYTKAQHCTIQKHNASPYRSATLHHREAQLIDAHCCSVQKHNAKRTRL